MSHEITSNQVLELLVTRHSTYENRRGAGPASRGRERSHLPFPRTPDPHRVRRRDQDRIDRALGVRGDRGQPQP